MRWLRPFALAGWLAAAPAAAEIYEWRDAAGDRHFTNRTEAVPAAYRSAATVLIAELPRPASEPGHAGEPAAAPADDPAPPSRGPAELADAYVAGLEAGMRISAGGGGGGGGGAAAGGAVEINGPLAVASVHAPEVVPFAPYGWDGDWPGYYPPAYFPFVTTSFDRGRSRHQTLRMLLQDQFQFDRDGPYAYNRWNTPGVGPPLAPFLPRGLPLPMSQYGRVIYR